MSLRSLVRHGGIAALAALSTAAGAQPTDRNQSAAGASVTLDTLTVTARHVAESTLDIPFTVTTTDAQAIDNHHYNTLEASLWQAPGVAVDSFGGSFDGSVKIRGVGAINKASLDDASVTLYQNGVPQPIGSISGGLLDTARVEVLKGPQGTLYGRNSEAGVINLVANQPEPYREGHVSGEWGNRGHYLGEAVFNAPFTERLSGRVAVRYRHGEHAMDNARDGGDPVTEPKGLTARASLRWRDGARDDVLLSVEHQRLRDHVSAFTDLDAGDPPRVSVPPGSINDRRDTTSLSLNWRHDLGFAQLTSVTGWGRYTNSLQLGPFFDEAISRRLYGRAFASGREMHGEKTQFFQELRLGSAAGARVFWTGGVNYYHSDRDFDFGNAFSEDPTFAFNPFNAEIARNFKTDSVAVFGEVTYPLTERLDVTAGLRHTWDEADYEAEWRANPGYLMPGGRVQTDAQSLSEDYSTGRLGLNYALTPTLRLYGIYARGHKAAGFSDNDSSIASGVPATPYEPAQVDSFELGVKAAPAHGRLELSAALFYNRSSDDHLYVMINPALNFANTTENFDTLSQGAELELAWRVHPRLAVNAGLNYTDATITSVPAGSLSTARKGNRVPGVSRWTGTLGLDYHQPIDRILGQPATLTAFAGYRYSGKRPNDPENHFDLDATHMVNARLGIHAGHNELYLWGNNLLDERSPIYGYYLPAVPAEYGGTGNDVRGGSVIQGRTFGIGYRYHF